MRKLAWAIVILLFCVSGFFFVRYVELTASLGGPQAKLMMAYIRALPFLSAAADALGTMAGIKAAADLALYLGFGFGLLGVLSVVILAATHRPVRDEDDDGAEADLCPRCEEPIKGFAITCRVCGHRFGPSLTRRR